MINRINYTVRQEGELRALEITGSITSVTAKQFLQIAESFLKDENLIIDMENVKFVTSSGIHSMLSVNYYARINGKKIIFLYPDEDLKSLINYSDNYGHLIFAESTEECRTKMEYFD